MGGDHKCPVCQATFTRPQHVARHMRSHTGDRPYKCQYCGDQFARSDLLSRHVNKCHASEKPPPGAPNTRRKGSASATRATTSKQACDQCVQSSLPCDGSNPCAKCVQRKCRCTFVKFHRQTAPVGPGHNPRPSGPSSSRLPGYGQADDFLLGPAPSNMPSMSDPYTSQFSFPYAPPPESISQALAMPPSDADYAKLRAQADYLRRQPNTMPTAGPGVPPVSTSLPAAMFDPRNPSASSWLGWSTDAQLGGRYLPPLEDSKQQIDNDLTTAIAQNYTGGAQSNNYSYQALPTESYNSNPSYLSQRRSGHERHSSADFASDGSSASIPSSATSSSVHLPLDLPQQQQATTQQQLAYHDAQAQAHANFLAAHPQQPDGGGTARASANPSGSQAEGGFSSAFGLMSLEDPNVLAGLSTDSAPFFSSSGMDIYPGDPDATPMPPKGAPAQAQAQASTRPGTSSGTPSREAETKELRDFWKQYLRTPLSGPNGLGSPSYGALLSGSNPHNPTSPNSGYRRPRVASLPSAKTPTTELYTFQTQHPANANSNHSLNGGGAGQTSSMRTTLHGNPDDLRSYEAAVLARKAPLHLNLVPKRARGHSMAIGSVMGVPQGSQGPHSAHPSGSGASYELHSGLSRPASSSSTSSLANAFGKPSNHQQQHVTFSFQVPSDPSHGNPSQHQDDSASPPSRGSTASLEDGDRDSFRPSFKRLPSQTLGPANAKRAMLEHEHDDDSDEDRVRAATGIDRRMPIPQQHLAPMQQPERHMMLPPPLMDRPMVGMTHRQRRMSAPSTSPKATSFVAAGQL